jgi:hypothetical protein
LVTVINWGGGLAAPAVADAVNAVMEVPMIPGSTISVTGTTTVPFTAWGDMIVTFPL